MKFGLHQSERRFYFLTALYNFSWAILGPVYTLFLLSRGLDLLQVNIVFGTYLIVAFLFEIPTGAVADVFGRKLSFILSCLVRMAAFLLYAYSTTFAQFLIAEFVDAVGWTLATGALHAWAVDEVRADGYRGSFDRIFARSQMVERSFMIVAGLVGGYLGEYGMGLNWFAGAAGFALTALAAIFLMRESGEPLSKESPDTSQRPGILETTRAGVRVVRENPVLLHLCLFGTVAAFAVMPTYHLWPPLMESLSGQGAWLMGWIFAMLNAAAILGSVVVNHFLESPRRVVVAVSVLVQGLMLGVAALSVSFAPALAGLLIFELSRGVFEPVITGWMNNHASSELRATILSVRTMTFTLGGAIGLVILGVIARATTIPTVWTISSVILLVVAAWVFVATHHDREEGADNVE